MAMDTDTMLGKLYRKLVTLPIKTLRSLGDLLQKIENSDWEEAFRRFLRKQPCWTNEGASKPLLEPVGSVTVSAVTTRRSVAEVFAGCDMGGNFKDWFGKMSIESQAELELEYNSLTRQSQDIPIMAEIFGRHITTLATVSRLIEAQKNGEDGPLLLNGYANIFYVRDSNGELRAVNVRRLGDVWNVFAFSVSCGVGWAAGGQVFSLATT